MILGLDVSTSITGATIVDQAGNTLYCESWDTRNKKYFPSLYQKASLIRDSLMDIKVEYDITEVFIERSLNSFRSGFSSAQTLSTLSRFNGIVSWLCYEIFQVEPEMVAATSARKTAGVGIKRGENAKEKVLKFVVDNDPDFKVEYTKFGNPKPGMTDMADSWIVARAGLELWKQKSLKS